RHSGPPTAPPGTRRTRSCGPCSGLPRISSCSLGSTITGPGYMPCRPRVARRLRSHHPDARLERLDSAGRATGSSTSQAAAAWPASLLVDPEPVAIRARDGVEIHAQLFHRSDVSGRRPAVIYVHGGPARQMLLGWPPYAPGGYYHRAYAMNQHLASKGHLVLS